MNFDGWNWEAFDGPQRPPQLATPPARASESCTAFKGGTCAVGCAYLRPGRTQACVRHSNEERLSPTRQHPRGREAPVGGGVVEGPSGAIGGRPDGNAFPRTGEGWIEGALVHLGFVPFGWVQTARWMQMGVGEGLPFRSRWAGGRTGPCVLLAQPRTFHQSTGTSNPVRRRGGEGPICPRKRLNQGPLATHNPRGFARTEMDASSTGWRLSAAQQPPAGYVLEGRKRRAGTPRLPAVP